MNADVNKCNAAQGLIINKTSSDETPTDHKIMTNINSDDMDTSSFPPFEEHVQNLQKRGISILLPGHVIAQQQKLHTSLQLGEQRFVTQQLEQQQHDVHKVKIKNRQVQTAKFKTQFTKQVRNKVSNKRKKLSPLNGADSLSDLSVLTHSPSHSNRFALLSDLEFTTTNTDFVNKLDKAATSTSIATNANINANSASPSNHVNKDDAATPVKSSRRFCPPIILFNVDIRNLVNQFKSKFPETEIKIINVSKNKSKLYVKELHAYNAIMQILKDKNISSHSFTPPENKQLSLIIRGLHCHALPEEIKADLDSLIPGTISDVKIFNTPFMKNNKIISNLFSVTLLPGKTHSDATHIKFLLLQKISWEKPHSTAKELQCKRCQRWGHIAKNCNHRFQCVKCDKPHEPGLCELTQNENSQAFYVNCKKWGHPANFKGCDAYKSLLANKMAKARNSIKMKEKAPSSSFVSSNKTYASILRQNNSSTAPGTKSAKLIKDFILIAREILNSEPLPLEVRLQNFIHNFKTLSPSDRKAECIKLLREIESADV